MAEEKASLYIHIPYCISKCRYCDFFSRPYNHNVPDVYIKALVNEIKYRFEQYKCDVIDTVYVGGGTPSLLTPEQILFLFDSLRSVKIFTPDSEISFEVNPDDVSQKLLQALEAAGVNRLSVGLQSMTPEVLKYAGRRASGIVNQKALQLIKENWHKSFSVDLISALPYETEQTFLESLKTVIDVRPDHISMYSLTIEENTPFGKALANGQMKYDFEKADNMWLTAKAFLEKNGYPQYEVSNFASARNQCRHNLVYWNHGDYIGAGSGATGTVYNKGGTGLRWTNTLGVEKYIQFWNDFNGNLAQTPQNIPQTTEQLSFETSEFEFFMMSLRKTQGFSKSQYQKIFNKELPQKFCDVYERWQKKGLAGSSERFYLNDKGLLFLNAFLEELI